MRRFSALWLMAVLALAVGVAGAGLDTHPAAAHTTTSTRVCQATGGTTFTCTLTIVPAHPMLANDTLTLSLSGNAIYDWTIVSGGTCLVNSYAIGGGAATYHVQVMSPGCAAGGSIVVHETFVVTGSGGGALTTAIASALWGAAHTTTITARNPDGSTFQVPSTLQTFCPRTPIQRPALPHFPTGQPIAVVC